MCISFDAVTEGRCLEPVATPGSRHLGFLGCVLWSLQSRCFQGLAVRSRSPKLVVERCPIQEDILQVPATRKACHLALVQDLRIRTTTSCWSTFQNLEKFCILWRPLRSASDASHSLQVGNNRCAIAWPQLNALFQRVYLLCSGP